MLFTTLLITSPMVRDLISYIFKKNVVSLNEIENNYLKKNVYGHIFNKVTIAFSLKECLYYNSIHRDKGKYSCNYLHTLVFGQILVEEYLSEEKLVANIVEIKKLKDRFNRKFGIKYNQFDVHFSKLRLLIPKLFIIYPYQRIEMNIDICKMVNFHE